MRETVHDATIDAEGIRFHVRLLRKNEVMQFLISVIYGSTDFADSDEMAAIDAFNDSLRENGHWIYANGISASSEARVIDNRKNAGITYEGPLHQGSENIVGLWIISAPDDATAHNLAHKASLSCNRKVELRALHGD